jgi:uncharacterized protein (DUF433 family)
MAAITLEECFGYTESVIAQKPVRQKGENVRSFPTYTIPEAAMFLGVKPATLRMWFCGPSALLHPSGRVGGLPLLSFTDAVEAYALYLMRTQHELSMQSIRSALRNLPKVTKARNPLISENLKIFEDYLIYDRPARGRHARQVVNLSLHDGCQLVINHVADIFANRVHKDASGKTVAIYPWKFWRVDKDSKPVRIDPEVMSGRLVVTGTRIPVSLIAARSRKVTVEAISLEYGIPLESIQKALIHVEKAA